jgi:hypothetical protein
MDFLGKLKGILVTSDSGRMHQMSCSLWKEPEK